MLNGFFVLCCLCQNAQRVHPFLQLHEYSGYLIHVLPQRALMKKKASLILQFRPESNAEIPITSLKSLGRISSRLSQGFSHPHHRQNRKKLANKTIYEDVFRFKTSTTSLQPLPFKPPRAIFQVSQKTFPYQNNKTQNNGIHTPKKHTKIQTKQNIQNTNPNKTKFQTKQNSDSKQTPQKKTINKSTATSSKHNKPKRTKKNTSLFSLWVHISEVSGVSPPWWLCITKAHCLSCSFRCLQSINLWTTRETRCPKTKASVTKTENNGRKEN